MEVKVKYPTIGDPVTVYCTDGSEVSGEYTGGWKHGEVRVRGGSEDRTIPFDAIRLFENRDFHQH